jgi:hypothetical protein
MAVRIPVSWLRGIAVAGLGLIVAGCGAATVEPSAPVTPSPAPAASSPAAAPTVLWPAPPDPLERTAEAGLEPEPKEYLVNHVHAHLDVFVDGQPITIPAGIGINVDDPGVRRFEEPDGSVGYGGIELCAQPCISPLHTHDADGILHTESQDPEPNTLGQFFIEWGVTLSQTCVGEFCSPTKPIAFYVDGKPYTGDPRAIELTDHKEIAIVIGTPPPVIPSTADFSRA